MKSLRNFLDKQKPKFSEGGKFSGLHSVFCGFESFLFVPDTVTSSGAHIRDAVDLKRTMITVVFALVPALLFGIYNIGYQHFQFIGQEATFWGMFFFVLWKVLPMIIVSYVVGLGIEFAVAQMRGHEINEGVLVTGILIPMIMPVEAPLWMIAVSTAFAVIVGKEIFGGTGMNIWNPALVARAFFFFAYPAKITGDYVWVAKAYGAADAVTAATPLAVQAAGTTMSYSLCDAVLGFSPGAVGETSVLAILIGAVILIVSGVGNWRTMLSVFVGGFVMALAIMGNCNDALMQLCLGGFAFGAVFMATDPVTSAQTNCGKYVYGALIGIMAIIIRLLNPGYPEGMMMAILLMNSFAPLIDWFVVQSNIKRRMKRAKVNAK